MPQRRRKFTDQIRTAIRNCGRTRYAICKATGIDPAVMSRFMRRKGGLSFSALDAIAKLLNWNLLTPDSDQRTDA